MLVARLVQSNAFVDEFRHKYCLYSCIDVAHDKNDHEFFGYFFNSCDCRELLSNALARLDTTTDSLSPTRSPLVQPSQSNQQTPETAVKRQIHVPVTISVSTHTHVIIKTSRRRRTFRTILCHLVYPKPLAKQGLFLPLSEQSIRETKRYQEATCILYVLSRGNTFAQLISTVQKSCILFVHLLVW